MAKAVVALAFALCFLAITKGENPGSDKGNEFDVHGKVYCDPCRVKFQTELSHPLSGAKVKLECKNVETEKVTLTEEKETEKDGTYVFHVPDDHEDELCEVGLVKSPEEHCSEPMDGDEKALIECAKNTGVHDTHRFANPIGYMTKTADSKCDEVLKKLGLHYVNGTLTEDDDN